MPSLQDKDNMRFANKAMLAQWAKDYKETFGDISLPENDDKLAKDLRILYALLSEVEKYSVLDSTAVNHVDKEDELCNTIYKTLNYLYKDLEEQNMDRGADTKEEDGLYYDTFRAVTRFHSYFEGQRNGYLELNVKGKEIKALGKSIKNPRLEDKLVNGLLQNSTFKTREQLEALNKNLSDVPLFPHDPSYNDIAQGGIGDCYLVSSLAEIAAIDPNKIKEAMRENDDGTVTVRFFERKMGPQGPASDTYEPVYVTVDKIAPTVGSATSCAWVDVIERAYAASGLRLPGAQEATNSQRYANAADPQELKALYEKLKNTDRSDWPSREECPWLIDKNGDLHEYQPSYDNIVSGRPGFFIEQFLGPGYQSHEIDFDVFGKTPPPWNLLSDSVRNCLDEAGSKMTERQNKEVGNDIGNLARAPKLYYKILTGKDELPKVESGELDWDNPDFKACMTFAEDLIHFYDDAVMPEIKAGVRKNFDLSGLEKYISKQEKEAEKDFTIYRVKAGMEYDPEALKSYEKLTKTLSSAMGKMYARYDVKRQYSGEYNTRELELADRIEKAISDHHPVTFGTRFVSEEVGDTQVNDGLNSQHGYSVLGVEKKKTGDGKELIFIRLRNPHGEGGREYDLTDSNNITKKATDEITNGETLVELGDAIKEGKYIHINEPPSTKFIPEDQQRITKTDISKYFRAVESTLKALEDAKARDSKTNSNEYNQLVKDLKEVKQNLWQMDGQNISFINDMFTKAGESAQKYLEYCEINPKMGSTRRKRMEAAHAVVNLNKFSKEHIMDPKDHIKTALADKIVAFASKKNNRALDEDAKEAAREKLMNSKEFKASFGKLDIVGLSKVDKVPDNELTKKYVTFIKEFKNAEFKKTHPEAGKDKHIEAPVQEKAVARGGMGI